MTGSLFAFQVAACVLSPSGTVAGPLGQRIDEHVRRLTALGAFDANRRRNLFSCTFKE